MSRGWDANGLRRANVPGGKGSRRFPGSLPSVDRDADGISFNSHADPKCKNGPRPCPMRRAGAHCLGSRAWSALRDDDADSPPVLIVEDVT
jgi:hypothetical protein